MITATDGSPAKILVVDDDPSILAVVHRLLRHSHLDVLEAKCATEALALLQKQAVSVVITDYMMPAMNGIDLLILVRERWPGTVGILMTASSDMQIAADAVNRHLISFFVPKPWDNGKFVDLVGQAVRLNTVAPSPAGPSSLVEALTAAAAAAPVEDTEDSGEDADGPQTLGRYELLEHLAEGGMADIYRARLRGSDGFEKALVVKKILPHLVSDRGFVERMQDEARLMVQLDHGNIVSVFDFAQTHGEYYLVMEYVDGMSLNQLLERPGDVQKPLPVAVASYVACQIGQALDYLHSKMDRNGRLLGIEHRDINPNNVLLSTDGAVKITDFGIAHSTGRLSQTRSGMVVGTVYYMSPEQLCGKPVDGRADIYSLGAVLYQMVTGQPPFIGYTYEEVGTAVVSGRYRPARTLNEAVDRQLSEIIDRALSRSPDKRFQSAAEFCRALEEHRLRTRQHASAGDLAPLVVGKRRARAS